MNFETMIDGLGVIAAVVVLLLALRYIGRFLGWVERAEIARQKAEAAEERKRQIASAHPQSTPAKAPDGVPADHVVAIAAAVAAYGFRVVHIADAAAGHAWASEGRWMHQTSHRTH